MKERPILFSGPMVRALLDGTKTQTRRITKPVRHPDLGNVYAPGALVLEREPQHVIDRCCPYGRPGDRLWVRETWNWFDPGAIPADRAGARAPFTGAQGNRSIPWVAAYAADGHLPYPGYEGRDHWRPSIHMPRWASRITLDINAVRIERLHDITEADAAAEGVFYSTDHMGHWSGTGDRWWTTAREAFRDLWISINGQPSWDANPWVWALKFDRIQATEKGKKQ